jgi:hypothetical protein
VVGILLQDLLKNTDAAHPDYKNIQDSLNQMMQVASFINESVRKSDNAKRIAALETKGANFDVRDSSCLYGAFSVTRFV